MPHPGEGRDKDISTAEKGGTALAVCRYFTQEEASTIRVLPPRIKEQRKEKKEMGEHTIQGAERRGSNPCSLLHLLPSLLGQVAGLNLMLMFKDLTYLR